MKSKKIHLAILQNEIKPEVSPWETVCNERSDVVTWESIDLTKSDWLEKIKAKHFDGLLAYPPNYTALFKSLYDERITILNQACQIPIYPSVEEIQIFENKKYLSYWLSAYDIPHPKTNVFYFKNEAINFVKKSKLPLVGKTNLGASGRGVCILKTEKEAIDYVENTFSKKGAYQNVGPNWKKKGLLKRAIKKLLNPNQLKAKLDLYKHQKSEIQNGFVILQEFIPHEYEWRCVRIGDSFFAHKKMVQGEKASGSLIKGYENPPLDLLDFVKKITDLKNFLSQSVDIFVSADGQYLVNEMQCLFGQSDPYQMLVDGIPGRYQMINEEWIFEAGDFNQHQSFLLRLDHFINILQEKKTDHSLVNV